MSDYIPDCSGLVKTVDGVKCRHGFIVYPSCRRDPMKKGIYKYVPCMDEELVEPNKLNKN